MNYTLIRIATNAEGASVSETKDFQTDFRSAMVYAHQAMADAYTRQRAYDAVSVMDNAGNVVYHDVFSKPVVEEAEEETA